MNEFTIYTHEEQYQHDQNYVLRRHDPLWPLPLLKTPPDPGLDHFFCYETTATRNKQTANINLRFICCCVAI